MRPPTGDEHLQLMVRPATEDGQLQLECLPPRGIFLTVWIVTLYDFIKHKSNRKDMSYHYGRFKNNSFYKSSQKVNKTNISY